MAAILIIEDNETMREGMVQVLKKAGYQVFSCENGEDAFFKLEHHKVDLIISDYRLPGMNGLEVLDKVKSINSRIAVIIITAYGSVDMAVEAMQKGAGDFITKPFSHNELVIKVEKQLDDIQQKDELVRLADENLYLKEELEEKCNFGEIIGHSEKMQAIYKTIDKVSRTDSTVIVYGESGTGKELVARAIHKAGNRADKSFVRVNCGALAAGVLESELFGHEKGAFTGAVRRKRGRFELAEKGTIFLDEIGDLPAETQVKLLRVLQEREFERVGGEETLTADVRVIAATNKNLQELVEKNIFRQDLYYRLHIIPIYLPPLRERPIDIPLLCRYFLKQIGKEIGVPDLTINDEALNKLIHYRWPGNIRELKNILERSAVLAEDSELKVSDLILFTENNPKPTETTDLNEILAEVERKTIKSALEAAHGIKSKAAQKLGIKTSALYYKLEKYGFITKEGEDQHD